MSTYDINKLTFSGHTYNIDNFIVAYPRSGAAELSAAWLSESSGGSALTPRTGKVYVLAAASTGYSINTQFRWTGSAYVALKPTYTAAEVGATPAVTASTIDITPGSTALATGSLYLVYE